MTSGDELVYWEVQEIKVADAYGSVRASDGGVEYRRVEPCKFISPGVEITGEVIWARNLAPGSLITISIGFNTMDLYGQPAYVDDNGDLAWRNYGIMPGDSMGAILDKNPLGTNAYVVYLERLFEVVENTVVFARGEDECVPDLATLDGLPVDDFRQLVDTCPASAGDQYRQERQPDGGLGLMDYSSLCFDIGGVDDSCSYDNECRSGQTCVDAECKCHPDSPSSSWCP